MIPQSTAVTRNPLLASISYHPYILLTFFTDSEWSQTRHVEDTAISASEWPLRGFNALTSHAVAYRQQVGKNYAEFGKAYNGPKDLSGQSLAKWLYNPVCYIPFGRSDLTMMLVDDFDPLHHLAAEVPMTIDEASVAFCPKLSSLGLRGSPFCELHDLLAEAEAQEKRGTIDRVPRYQPAFHPFQDKTPLLMFSKLRMEGLACLGQGLLFQQALFRAMGDCIRYTIDQLGKKAKKGDGLVQTMAEVKATRCCFLDLQGAEEIGLLTFCQNYSVAAAILSHLRSLTFTDVFKADATGLLRKKLGPKSSPCHKQVFRALTKAGEEPVTWDHYMQNHVFRWTHSTLAVSPNTYLSGDDSANCHGYVQAFSEFQISAGHRERIKKNAFPSAETDVEDGRRKQHAIPEGLSPFDCYQMGTSDVVLVHDEDKDGNPTRGRLPLVHVQTATEIAKTNRIRFGLATMDDRGRHVVDIATNLGIPLPRIPPYQAKSGGAKATRPGKTKQEHHPLIDRLVPQLRQRLFGSSITGVRPSTRAAADLDVKKLKDKLKRLGVPTALRQSVDYLYQHFAALLSDPYHFDVVLDLFDTFLTLHSILTKKLPAELKNKPYAKGKSEWHVLDRGLLQQLASLVQAIHNALVQRTLTAYPQSRILNMPIDFRGGLNQIVLAADAPMKCGLGVFRRIVFFPERTPTQRDRVAGLARVSLMPGAWCHGLDFGLGWEPILGFFEMDVPHFLHPASYVDYLHESFHLIFDSLAQTGGKKLHRDLCEIDHEVMKERMSEIFAMYLTYRFVFKEDKNAFLFCNIVNFARSTESSVFDDREIVERMTELLLRLYFVIRTGPKEPRLGEEAAWGDFNRNVVKKCRHLFPQSPYLSNNESLWTGPGRGYIEAYQREQLRALYPLVTRYLPHIYSKGNWIYEQFLPGVGGDDSLIRSSVKKALASGRPVIRGLGERILDDDDRPTSEDPGPEMLEIVCEMLRTYISRVKDWPDRKMYLRRKMEHLSARDPDFSEKGNWSDFLIDRGSAGMFCPVPASRKARLQKQIVLLKTFWDLSTTLRGRRLADIICRCWPKEETTTQPQTRG